MTPRFLTGITAPVVAPITEIGNIRKEPVWQRKS